MSWRRRRPASRRPSRRRPPEFLEQRRRRPSRRSRSFIEAELRRRRDPAARLRRHLSLCRAPARSARGRAAAGRPRPASPNMPRSKSRRLGIQVAFALMFAVIALIVLMSAVLIGLNFANWLVAPIRRLIGAANLVSTGDLHVQVPVHRSEGDLAQLGETFNKMTQELRTQRDDLVQRQRPDRQPPPLHRGGAVVGAAPASSASMPTATIGILNRSAEKLIGHRGIRDARTIRCRTCVPELDEHDEDRARGHASGWCRARSRISRDGHERNLSVRVSAEQTGQSRDSYIITLDDITELVSAQRTSAWARRRAAHRARNQESADADPAFGRTHPPQIRQGHHRGQARSSSNAPTRSCGRSTTSGGWSMNSRASRACRSRSWKARTSPTPCGRRCS